MISKLSNRIYMCSGHLVGSLFKTKLAICQLILLLLALQLLSSGCIQGQTRSDDKSLTQFNVRKLIESFAQRYVLDMDMSLILTSPSSLGPTRRCSYVYTDHYIRSLSIPRCRLAQYLFQDINMVPELLNYIDENTEEISKILAEMKKKQLDTSSVEKFIQFIPSKTTRQKFLNFRSAVIMLGSILGYTQIDDAWRPVDDRVWHPTSRTWIKGYGTKRSVIERTQHMIEAIKQLEVKLLDMLGTGPNDKGVVDKLVKKLRDLHDVQLGGEPEGLTVYPWTGENIEQKSQIWNSIIQNHACEAAPLVLTRIQEGKFSSVYIPLLNSILGLISPYEVFIVEFQDNDNLTEPWKTIANQLLEKERDRLLKMTCQLYSKWSKAACLNVKK